LFQRTPYIPIISSPSYVLSRALEEYIWLEQKDKEAIVGLYEYLISIRKKRIADGEQFEVNVNAGRLHNIDQNVIVFDLRPGIAPDRRVQVVYIPGTKEFHITVGFINRPEQVSNRYIGSKLGPGSVGIFSLALVIIAELLSRGELVAIEANSKRKFEAYERHFKKYYNDYLESGQLILRFIE